MAPQRSMYVMEINMNLVIGSNPNGYDDIHQVKSVTVFSCISCEYQYTLVGELICPVRDYRSDRYALQFTPRWRVGLCNKWRLMCC